MGSLGGLLVGSALFLLPTRARTKLLPWLLSYAVGTLLGVALLAFVPESLENLSSVHAGGALLAGILTLFVIEKLVLWRHCHTEACDVHDSSATLILIGGGLHLFTDGAIICAATLVSVPLGISTAVAVAAHQIPQEMLDELNQSTVRGMPFFVYTGIKEFLLMGNDSLMLKSIPSNLAHISTIQVNYNRGSDSFYIIFWKGNTPERSGELYVGDLADTFVEKMGIT